VTIGMHKKTVNFLNDLNGLKWFYNVGKINNSMTHTDTIFIRTWDEAQKHSTSEKYKEVLLETSNELTIFLHDNHMKNYRLWNIKVKEIKPLTERIIREKIKETEKESRIPKNFPNMSLRWDILGICMSLEYSEYIQTDYYKKIMDWYLNGNFPCGWIGDVRENFEGAFELGKLVVF
jgi:hypothetical protein